MVYEIKTPELKLASEVSKGVIDATLAGAISVKDANIANKTCNRLVSNFGKRLKCTRSELPRLNQIIAEDVQSLEAMKARLDSINARDPDREG